MTHTLHRQGKPGGSEGGLRPSAPDIPLREPRGLRGDDAPGLGGDLPLREGPGQLREPQPHLGRRRDLRHGGPQDGGQKPDHPRGIQGPRDDQGLPQGTQGDGPGHLDRRLGALRGDGKDLRGNRPRPPHGQLLPGHPRQYRRTSRRGRSWRSTPCAATRWSPPT